MIDWYQTFNYSPNVKEFWKSKFKGFLMYYGLLKRKASENFGSNYYHQSFPL